VLLVLVGRGAVVVIVAGAAREAAQGGPGGQVLLLGVLLLLLLLRVLLVADGRGHVVAANAALGGTQFAGAVQRGALLLLLLLLTHLAAVEGVRHRGLQRAERVGALAGRDVGAHVVVVVVVVAQLRVGQVRLAQVHQRGQRRVGRCRMAVQRGTGVVRRHGGVQQAALHIRFHGQHLARTAAAPASSFQWAEEGLEGLLGSARFSLCCSYSVVDWATP